MARAADYTDQSRYWKRQNPCHTSCMETFAIVPRGRGYWIEAIAEDGSRKVIQRYDTEDAALGRLRVLQQMAEDYGKRNRHGPEKDMGQASAAPLPVIRSRSRS
jgi:hypothetical protein